MRYPFICECGHKEIIEMPITEAHNDGHYCPECGKEMMREPKSLVCGLSISKCDGFYRKYN